MTTKIVQKHPDRGTREFELVDDAIEYRISSPLGDEELSVVLSGVVARASRGWTDDVFLE